MTDNVRSKELMNEVIEKITVSAMNRFDRERLLQALKRAKLIHPECEKVALKLIGLCKAEDDRTPAEYAGREHEWEDRSPFLLADGSPKPEVVEWAKQLYVLDPDIGMYSVVECIYLHDLRQLHVAFTGIGGWPPITGEWPPRIGRSA